MKANQQSLPIVTSGWGLFLAFGSFAAILFGMKLWLIGSFGNATPYWDQWDAEAANLYKPFLEGTIGWSDLLAPHNEHRIFSTRLLALALLTVNGIWNPLLQMVVNAVLHIVTLCFGIALMTRVIGHHHLLSLLVFSLILFGVPYAWENTLAGFQAQFYFVLLFSFSCLWLTVTHPPLSARWWCGVVCAMFAFLSLASGIFALAAAAIIGFVFYVMGLRQTRRQLLAMGILAGLFMLGTVLTPSLEYHASLKAASFPQFRDALMAVLSWPISPSFFSSLIRNLPAFVFVGVMLWKRPPAHDRKWFLLALVVWIFGQAASIAYGRAVGNLSSRYLDLFAIGILVNFACLISITQGHIGKWHGSTITCVSVWVVTVLISLGMYANKHNPNDLSAKRDNGIAQEINTRTYLATGDFKHLKDKPLLHVPYPNSERLALILNSSSIRTILPTKIRGSMAQTSIESKPAGAFVVDGSYPSTPKLTDMTLGSYGAQGDAATGQATIRFDDNKQKALLAIPVAGYPLSNGIKLEIEQNGQRNPVIMKRNPKESWGIAYAMVDSSAFSIQLTDMSNTAWLAVGAPSVSGRLDEFTSHLLANYHLFIMLGLVALVLMLTQCGLTNSMAMPTED